MSVLINAITLRNNNSLVNIMTGWSNYVKYKFSGDIFNEYRFQPEAFLINFRCI